MLNQSLMRNGVAAALVLLSLVAVGLSVPSGDLDAQDRARVTSECLDCHDGKAESLRETPHFPAEEGIPVACTDCHLGDERHWQDDPEQYAMTDLRTADVELVSQVCSGCHQNAHQQNMKERNVHADADVNCTGCHSVHGGTNPGLLQKAEPELCLDCHEGVRSEFARPFRHPVSDGIVRCSECHMALDENAEFGSFNGVNSVCFSCHPEFQGPFPYEHQATLDFSTEEGGCLSCHAAHGGYLARMLKQPYEAPHFTLCSQCHTVPLHNSNPRHGTEWAGVPCNNCHVDIHGSYSNRNLLDPALETQGCFNVGCHKF